MKTLSDGVHIWASLYPFPQIILGGYLTATRGITVCVPPPPLSTCSTPRDPALERF